MEAATKSSSFNFSIKIGSFSSSSTHFSSKKKALGIPDPEHYKINSIKLFSTNYISSIEIQYQSIYEENADSFFVDSFQNPNNKLQKDLKITTYSFAQDEEIIEISGRCGSFIDQLAFKTSRGKTIISGGDGGGSFIHKAPLGYCFSLVKSCVFKEFIEGIDVELGLSTVFRIKIYKTIEQKRDDEIFSDYMKMEEFIQVDENLFRERFDFEENSDNKFSYRTMRNEVQALFKRDKLGLLRYYLKYLYLDKKNSLETNEFPMEDVLDALKEIYKLLKYPRLLFLDKDDNNQPIKIEDLLNTKGQIFSKNHAIYNKIFGLLILVNVLLESPAPFASGFTYLKNLLLNINDLYLSYLITVTTLQKEKQKNEPLIIEKMKKILTPNVTLYGHHLGFYLLSELQTKEFMDFSRNVLKIGRLEFKRVNSQELFFYERQMFVHCFNRKLFNLESLASTLIGIRQFRSNRTEKPNETFFILTYEPLELESLQPLEISSNQQLSSLSLITFAKHLISSIFVAPLEVLAATYAISSIDNQLIRLPNWHDPRQQVAKPLDVAFRNPLYVLDLPQIFEMIPQEILEKLSNLALERLFVEFLAWIKLETCLISFEFFAQEPSSDPVNDNKTKEKVPVFSLSEETLSFLYRYCLHNLAFIKDNWHLKLIDILFHLNPIVSLTQEQLLKYFPDHQNRLVQIKKFEFDVIFARSPMEIKKIYRPKVRKYTEKIKKIVTAKGKFPIYRTVTNWLKNFPLNKLEHNRVQGFLQEMLRCLPYANNHEIYTHWNSYINWESIFPLIISSPQIINLLIDLKVPITNFKAHDTAPFLNALDLITSKNASETLKDLSIFEVYVKKAKMNPDAGFPFSQTPFERALENENHVIIKKLLELNGGVKANPTFVHQYVKKFFEYDEYEVLFAKENLKEIINFNVKKLLDMHPPVKWRLVWELMHRKPDEHKISEYTSFVSCEGEEIFVLKSNIQRKNEKNSSFVYRFEEKKQHLFYEIFFDNEPRFHGLHLGITSLVLRLMGPQSCVIPTKFIKDQENNCFEIKPFFDSEHKVIEDLASGKCNPLQNLQFDDICERILMNIVLLAGEVCPEDEIIQVNCQGKQRLLPWDFSKLFTNYYFKGESPQYQKHFIKTISYLLCLDEMKQPISQEIRARLLFVDLYKCLDEWLHELSELHWNLSHFIKGAPKEEEYLGVLFKQNMIAFMVFRFLKLQNFLMFNEKPTLFEIFKHLDPEICGIYEKLKGNNYQERYKELLVTANQELESFKYSDYSIFLQIKSHISREVMSIFKQEELIGPEEALLELKMVREGFTKEKFSINLLEFDKIPDFDLILFALRSMDFEEITKEIQEKWVYEGLIQSFEKQFHSYSEKAMSLKLKNMRFLTAQNLEKMSLLKQIRCLILQGCLLSDEIILILATECPLLESLDLSFNQNLKSFEQNSKYFNIFDKISHKNAVLFQSLKYLNLQGCENLHSLTMQADLETICLQDCKKLAFFRVDPISLNHSLSYVDFQGTIAFPEKDLQKLISTDFFEIKLDEKSCKGAFAALLKEFPSYPRIPYCNSRSNFVRIPSKTLDGVLMVLERPENKHLLEFFSVKDMTDVELAKLCVEINKKLPERGLTIKHLDLSHNKNIQLTANVSMMKTVASGGFPFVEILNLSNLNLSNSLFVKLFGEWLKVNKVMKKLILNEVSIKNEDLAVVFDAVNKKNSVLEAISLRNNGINFVGFQTIASFLENNTSLKYLDISYNIFEEKSIKILFKALTYNKHLLTLILKAVNPKKAMKNQENPQNFYIQDELIDEIRDALNNNRVLKAIDLRNHPISSVKAASLAKILQMSNNLSEIKVKSSLFSDESLQKRKPSENIKESSANSSNILLTNFLNQIVLTNHRTESYSLNKSQRNVLPDTWVFGLSIDGGGMRGIIPAILMENLINHTKSQLFETFDYIGGSSIGGILALGSAGTLDGKSPICMGEECVEIFTKYGKEIFGKIKNKMDPLGIMANKYSESGLESVIKKYFKNSYLSETLTNVLVTSVNKNNNEMMIFDSRKAFCDPEFDFFMRNVARATSAAPTFFPAAEFYNLVGSKFYSLVDGGVGKNDPTYFVFEGVKSIAENYGIPNKFSVISLGTGEIADQKILSQNAGVIEVKNLLNKCIDTHTELDQAIFKEKYGNTRYRRFQTLLKFPKNVDISLDNVDPEVVKVYKETASGLAEEFLIENYGEFQNVSLIDWLAENTARKKELF